VNPILSAFDQQFAIIDRRSRELLSLIDDAQLFSRPVGQKDSMLPASCGEHVLRSAAMVEKAFGGITTRLWDDPFEWTLPEELASKVAVLQYLDEVETTRRKGMTFFGSDAELQHQIPAPVRVRPIFDVLLDALLLATHYQGRAFAVFQMVSDAKLPRL
jgi:hypothetical protein